MNRSTLTQARRLARRGCFALRPLSAAALLLLTAGVQATGTGDLTVLQGAVESTRPNAGTQLLNVTTQNAYVQTPSFSVGVNEHVGITMLNGQGILALQVTGFDASRIFGSVQSNGRLFLMNPNGIVFGATARVDVGSLVATTLSISQEDFKNNRIMMTRSPTEGRGDLAGVVRNDGAITAANGFVVLAGHQVINTGDISATNGRVGLAAADKLLVDVEGDGLLFFEVEGQEAGARLAQLGRIQADGGSVELMAAARGQFADTVLNMAGVVQARGLGTKQGRVVIHGGDTGITEVSGTVDTTGAQAGQKGGDITVTGDRVLVRDTALLDASGSAGGGRLLVGGDFHGANAAVRNAQVTVVGSGARLKSNALQSGQGGDVVVWADDTTRYFGSIESKGGAQGGDGGAVEVSGKASLAYQGAVDASAPQGKRGTLLLDPRDINITSSASGINWTGAAAVVAPADAEVNVASINAAAADVTLIADQDVFVNAAINIASAGKGLSITAGRDLTVNQSVTTNNGFVQLTATGGAINLNNNVSAGTAALTLTGPVALGGTDATRTLTGNAVNLGAITGNGKNLTLVAGTATTLGGAVTGVATLNASGSTLTLINADVTTTAGQTYGASTLGGTGATRTLTGTTVALGVVSGGTKNLTVAGSTSATLGGVVTGVGTLDTSGSATTAINADVTTSAGQTYGAATLGGVDATRTLTGTTVSLGAVTGAGKNLTLAGTTSATLGGAVTGVLALTTTGSATTAINADVTTTAGQAYGASTLGGSDATRTLTGTTLTLGTVAGAGKNLTLAGSTSATLGGAVTNVATLDTTASTTTGINVDVTTTGGQTYGASTLGGAGALRTLTGTTVALGAITGAGKNLTVAGTTSATLGGTVTGVGALTTTGSATTAINADVTTTAGQTYGAATLGGTGATRTLAGTTIVLGTVTGAGKNLTLNGTTSATLGGAISGVNALDASGTTATSVAANVTTTAGQTYAGTVTLSNASTFTGSAVTFNNLSAAANNLGIHANAITVNGAATGTGTLNLAAATDAGSIGVNSATTTDLAINNALLSKFSGFSSLIIGGSTVTGNIGFGDTTLLFNTLVQNSSGDVSFAKVDGTHSLNVQTGGTLSLNDLIGGTAALTSLQTNGPVTINTSLVKTSGNQTYGGTVTLAAAATSLEAGSGKISLTNVDGGGAHDLTLKSANGAADAIKTTGTISNVQALTVDGASTLGGNVTSTGDQSYTGVTTLASDVTMDAGAAKVSLAGAVGANHNLTLKSTSADAAAIKTTAAVSGVQNLSVQGRATLGANVGSTGTQDYTGPVTLSGPVTVSTTNSAVRFRDKVDGAQALIVNAGSANARFDGAVGRGTALTSLNVTAGSVDLNGGAVTTTNAQTYTAGNVNLGNAAGTTFTASALTVNGNLASGANDLSVFADAMNVTGSITSAGGTTQAAIAARLASTTIGVAGGAGTFQVTSALLNKFANFGGVTVGRTDGTGAITFGNLTGGAALNRSLTVRNGSADITFGQIQTDADGAYTLDAATTSGTVRLNGDIGTISRLSGLTVGGAARVGGATSIFTSGTQHYTGAVTLANGVAMNGSAITYDRTVSGAQGLTISGTANFKGAVNIASLSVTGQTNAEADITTTGGQTYSGTVNLLDDVSFTGTSLTFNNLAASTHDLGVLTDNLTINGTVSGTGTAQIAAYTAGTNTVVGGTGAVGELVVDATRFAQFSSFSRVTVGRADGTGTVTLGSAGTTFGLPANLTLLSGTGDINVLSAITGARSLALNTSGTTRISADVSGLTALSTDAGGTTRLNASSIQTSGTQTYGDAVILDGTANLTGTTVNFGGTVNGASAGDQALTVNGNARFGQAVGGSQALDRLIVSGSTQFDHGGARTVDYQDYFGAVTLGDASNFASNSNFVRFRGTVTGPQALTSDSLVGTVFLGAVDVASVNVASGLTYLYGHSVTTSGAQTYAGDALVGNDNVLTGTNIGVTGVVNSELGTSFSLNVNASGAATFGGAVGTTTALRSLGTSGATNLNGGTITTTGAQTYGGAVTLGANTTVNANTVDFNGTVNGARSLQVNDSGATTFHGNVGGTTALTSLTTAAGGTTTLPAQVTTTGAQVYGDPVTLSANTTLSANSVTMANLIGASHALTVAAGTGLTTFNGSLSGLSGLDVTGTGTTRFLSANGLSTTGAQHYGGNVTVSATNASFDGSSLDFDGGVAVANNLSLNTDTLSVAGALSSTGGGTLAVSPKSVGTTIGVNGGAGAVQVDLGQVSGFTQRTLGRIDGTGVINVGTTALSASTTIQSGTGAINLGALSGANALTVNTAGVTSFNGDVAGLSTLTTDAAGSTHFNANAANVTTALSFVDAVVYGGNVSFTAPSITLGGGASGGTNLSLITNALNLTGNLAGSGELALQGLSAGTTIGVAGGAGTLQITQAMLNQVNGFASQTIGRTDGTGAINANALTLARNTKVQSASGAINFNSTVDGAHALTANTAGVTRFGGDVGGTTALTSLTTDANGGTQVNASQVRATSALNFGDAVTYTGSTTFSAATQQFAGGVAGGTNLTLVANTLTSGGSISGSGILSLNAYSGSSIGLAGAAGDLQVTQALLNQTSGFTQHVIGGSTGAVSIQSGDLNLVVDTLLQSGTGGITLGAISGGTHSLTVNTAGVSTFSGNVTGVSTLTTDAGGSTHFNGSLATASNALSFGDAVVYGGNVSFTAPSLTFGGGASGGTNLTLATNSLSLGGDLSGSGELTLQPTGAGTTIGLVGGVGTLQITQATLNRVTGFASQTIGRTDGTGAINANALTLARDTKVQSASGAVTFGATVDGAHALTVNTTGNTNFNGDVGGTTALASLTTDAGGTTNVNASQVRATGAMAFGDAVTYIGDTTFSAASQQFAGGVTGGANLTLVANTLTAGGPISGTGVLNIKALSVNSIGLAGAAGDLQITQALLDQASGFTQHIIGDSTGAGTIRAGALNLAADTTLQSGAGQIEFESTVDGAHALAVNTAGVTRFQGAVGSTTALSSVTTDAPGSTALNGGLVRTTGAQRYNDTVTTNGTLSLIASTVSLHTADNLSLGVVNLGLGGDISTDGALILSDSLTLGSGTLTLSAGASGGAGGVFSDPELSARPGLVSGNMVLREAAAAIKQTGGTVTTAVGSTLDLRAANRGSILIDHTTNDIAGDLKAVSGPEGDTNAGRFAGSGSLPLSFVRVDSSQIHSAGIEADAVKLTANTLTTNAGTKIRARLPYINAQGIESSVAALTLVLKQPSVLNQFGTQATSSWIQVDLGNAHGGFLTVRPKGAGAGSSAVYLGGSDGNVPFYDGTSKASEIQVYFNGRVPSTPQEVGALSAVTAVIEESRRARFDEAVRTENVSSRLRTGVIAEVGAGRPATEGTESILMPAGCTPNATLGCQ